jgi:hypothetical protein
VAVLRDIREAGFRISYCLLASALAGVCVVSHRAPELLGLGVAAIALTAAVRRWGTGVWHGLLLIALVDGLPGPALESESSRYFGQTGTNAAAYLLIASLVLDNLRMGSWNSPRPLKRAVLCWAGAYLVLCFIAVARVAVFQDESSREWAHIGIGYVALAVLVPLFAMNLTDERRRNSLLATCAVGAVWDSLVLAASSLSGSPISFFVHITNRQLQQQGLARVYSTSVNLISAAIPFALGYALTGAGRRVRRLGWLVFTICIIGIGFSLTRAFYFAVIASTVSVIAIWGLTGGWRARAVRSRVLRTLALVAVSTGLALFLDSGAIAASPIGGIAGRAAQTFTPQEAIENDVRLEEASTLEHILGGEWLFGLGFQGQYYPGLPQWDQGLITDGDVGVLNVVLALGVTGAILTYIPFVTLASVLATRRWRRRDSETGSPLAFGGTGFAVLAMASSPTLCVMFYLTGTGVCAAAIGLGLAALGSSSTSDRAEYGRPPQRPAVGTDSTRLLGIHRRAGALAPVEFDHADNRSLRQ